MRSVRPLRPAPEWDGRFTRMCGVSAIAHVAVVIGIVLLSAGGTYRPPPMIAYTVEITDPNALGGRLPPGPPGRDRSRAAAKAEPKPPPAKPAPAAGHPSGEAAPGGTAAGEAPARDAYSAAAERWRSRAAGQGGGLGGTEGGSGPIGTGGEGPGGGGQLV